jgi:hypothetical protein
MNLFTTIFTFSATILFATHAQADQAADVACDAVGLPLQGISFQTAALNLPFDQVNTPVVWQAVLLTPQDDRLLWLQNPEPTSDTRLVIPLIEWASSGVDTHVLLMAKDQNEDVVFECPPHPLRILPPAIRPNAYLELIMHNRELAVRTQRLIDVITPEAAPLMTRQEQNALHLEDLDNAEHYLNADAQTQRVQDAIATYVLDLPNTAAVQTLDMVLAPPQEASVVDKISFNASDFSAQTLAFRPDIDRFALHSAQDFIASGLRTCPQTEDELQQMVAALNQANQDTGGTIYAKEKATLKSVEVVLIASGVGLISGSTKAATTTANTLNTYLAFQTLLDDVIRGTYPSKFTNLFATATPEAIYADSLPEDRIFRVETVELTTQSAGWSMSKSAFDLTMAAIGGKSVPGDLKQLLVAAPRNRAALASRVQAAHQSFRTTSHAATRNAQRDIYLSGAEGVRDGEVLNNAYSHITKYLGETSEIRTPPEICRLDLNASTLIAANTVDLPLGNALRAVNIGIDNREFTAVNTGQGAVAITFENLPPEFKTIPELPTTTVRIDIPQIAITIDGPSGISPYGTGNYEFTIENSAPTASPIVQWDHFPPNLVAAGPHNVDGYAMTPLDVTCEARTMLLTATYDADFLEQIDVAPFATRQVTLLADQDECEDVEDQPDVDAPTWDAVRGQWLETPLNDPFVCTFLGSAIGSGHGPGQTVVARGCKKIGEATFDFADNNTRLTVNALGMEFGFQKSEQRYTDIRDQILFYGGRSITAYPPMDLFRIEVVVEDLQSQNPFIYESENYGFNDFATYAIVYHNTLYAMGGFSQADAGFETIYRIPNSATK